MCRRTLSTKLHAPQGISTHSLLSLPWLGTPGIVTSLSEHSVLPFAASLFYYVQADQLIQGPKSGGGLLQLNRIEPSAKGFLWTKIIVDTEIEKTTLTVYYDPNELYHSSGELKHNPGRVPVTETVVFFSDHWEQRNVNGTFTGRVGPSETVPQ